MKRPHFILFAFLCMAAEVLAVGICSAFADDNQTAEPEQWNFHFQNTDIVQADPPFSAKYSGPLSLNKDGEIQETFSADIYSGVRLWDGAAVYADGLMWQGFGLSKTFGVEAFPNGEGFRLGTETPDETLARLFFRQVIGFGGEKETVDDDELHLADSIDVSRLTLTIGKLSPKDIFDNNSYANDPRTQFMNWALMANEAWDYPANSLGFITGGAAELNQPDWTLRYGLFQVARDSNGKLQDSHLASAWAMVTEFEQRFEVDGLKGAVRPLAYLNRARMGSYREAVDDPAVDVDITQTREYRYKYGFCLNAEQEIIKNVGIFSRLGWSDGHNEAWMFSDVDYGGSLGVSVKGEAWGRDEDVFGIAGDTGGISPEHRRFLAAGGTGILAGDGALSYHMEKTMETYYDFKIWKTLHGALDYQFIADPSFNGDRGPVSVFGARIHLEL